MKNKREKAVVLNITMCGTRGAHLALPRSEPRGKPKARVRVPNQPRCPGLSVLVIPGEMRPSKWLMQTDGVDCMSATFRFDARTVDRLSAP